MSDAITKYLDEIQKMYEAATKGPWYWGCTDDDHSMNARYVGTRQRDWAHDNRHGLDCGHTDQEPPDNVVAITLLQSPCLAGNGRCDENAAFIAASRDAVPRLVKALRCAITHLFNQTLYTGSNPALDEIAEILEAKGGN